MEKIFKEVGEWAMLLFMVPLAIVGVTVVCIWVGVSLIIDDRSK